MSTFLNSLKDKLTAIEQEMGNLPRELDSIVARLDRGKLTSLSSCLNQEFNKLLDQLLAPQRNMALLFSFIFTPNGFRPITEEDLSRWRDDHKSDIRVVIGKGRVEVITLSELAKEYKTAASQVILVAQQQTYTVLGWDQHQKLLDEIGKLIGEDKEQGKITGPPGVVGIIVTTTHSTKEVKILPKSSPL